MCASYFCYIEYMLLQAVAMVSSPTARSTMLGPQEVIKKLVQSTKQYMYTMKVSMNRIKHQSKSGTKCFLCQVKQMDLDLENPDPLVNYDYSSS